MDFKLLGCILLIIGTSVGAGMLALPIATAEIGYIGAVILLIFCWFVMTVSAYLLLEINLWLPLNSNLISMAKATIGPVGQIISWVTFLLLLYSLLCAYIAGGSDLLNGLLHASGIGMPAWLSAIIFSMVFGSIVYWGIHWVDYTNRGLMIIKFGAFFLLVLLLFPFVSQSELAAGKMIKITSISAVSITIISFGYAAIVPSLRIYLQGDIKKLKMAILIGGFIPLLCYIAWDAVTMGVIPQENLLGLIHAEKSTGELVITLSNAVKNDGIIFFIKLFTSICVLTSFLSVALTLTDFLADGFQLEKKGKNKMFILAMTILPPLFIVIFFPNAFIIALEYAGIYCVILLILLPSWMAWRGRYHRPHIVGEFEVPGGKPVLLMLIIFSFIMIAGGIWSAVF